MRKLTKVRVIARISVDVTTPPPERKFDGIFQIVTEFSPMASPAFEVGRYVWLYSDLFSGNSNLVAAQQTLKSSSRAYSKRPFVAPTLLTPNPSVSLLA
jgi:hypothetical protein